MSSFTVSRGILQRPLGGLLVIVALASAGCASSDVPRPAPPPRTIELPGRHLVTVVERDAGASIVLDAAQELTVRLPLDSLAVTAGLDWLLVDVKPEVLANGASKFELDTRDHEDVGGFVVWRFTPQKAGTTQLRFELRRVHGLEPARRSASYVVRVK